jgi:hypothetical protein
VSSSASEDCHPKILRLLGDAARIEHGDVVVVDAGTRAPCLLDRPRRSTAGLRRPAPDASGGRTVPALFFRNIEHGSVF